MRIDNAKMPKSSFLSMEKDTSLIINKMLDNPRLKRLLYYTSKDALNRPNLNEDQSLDLIKYENFSDRSKGVRGQEPLRSTQ